MFATSQSTITKCLKSAQIRNLGDTTEFTTSTAPTAMVTGQFSFVADIGIFGQIFDHLDFSWLRSWKRKMANLACLVVFLTVVDLTFTIS